MGKLTTYMIMMTGIMALFYFTGLTRDCENPNGALCQGDEECLCVNKSPSSSILDLVITPQNIVGSTMYSKISLVLTGITTLALLGVGFLYGNIKLALLGPVASYFLLFLSDFLTVIARIWSVHPIASVLATLVLLPLFVYYIIAVLDWWSGTD